MTLKRPYPESYLAVHHRAPRVATLADGRALVLTEPGFESADWVLLHICEPLAAREGMDGTALTLVGSPEAVFAAAARGPVVAGIWCDTADRVWLAWSDSHGIAVRRSRLPVTDVAPLADGRAWESFDLSLPGTGWQLGSGMINPADADSLVIVAIQLPEGAVCIAETGTASSPIGRLHTEVTNRSPTLAIDAAGDRVHVVWDTDGLNIRYRAVDLAELRCGDLVEAEPFQVWEYCHNPDVAVCGEQVIVGYTGHMQHIKYGWYDGRDWHLDNDLTVLHPRFAETLQHSPWLWTDGAGCVHLSFVCLTRCLVFDSKWTGAGFADPQPVEGLFHASMFTDEIRVKAERMSLDRNGGTFLLSSSFLPARHGVYQSDGLCTALRADEPVLFLDMADVAELTGATAQLETMGSEAEPVFEPTGRDDFDGLGVFNGGSVLKVGDRYQMWYGAKALTPEPDLQWYDQVYVGYAESDDGRHWQRTETNNGSAFHGRPAPHRLSNIDHNACVFIDPEDEPARRYKAIKFETRSQRHDHVLATGEPGYLGLPRRGWLCTSGDGLTWTREEVTVAFPGAEPISLQPQGAIYDPRESDPQRRYKVVGFSSLCGRRRGATLAFSPDCRHWTAAERSPLLDSMMAVTPVRAAGPYAQLHDATIARCGRYLLMFYQNQFTGARADIRLAFSRDNERIKFCFPETPLVALGASGAWDSGYLMAGDFVTDTERMFYYYGAHSDAPFTEQYGMLDNRVCAGRAGARRDRFVALSPSGSARLVTVPFSLATASPVRLEVNAKLLSAGAVMRVGLAPAEAPDRVIAGLGPADCTPITGDSVAHPVRWGERERLPEQQGPIRIVCEWQGAAADSLYALTARKA
jgi:hypothetical protein